VGQFDDGGCCHEDLLNAEEGRPLIGTSVHTPVKEENSRKTEKPFHSLTTAVVMVRMTRISCQRRAYGAGAALYGTGATHTVPAQVGVIQKLGLGRRGVQHKETSYSWVSQVPKRIERREQPR
jgi:hypothetical protein